MGLLTVQKSLVILDVETRNWEIMPNDGDVPEALFTPTMNYHDGYIYVAGGVDLTKANVEE